jgi:hypothetical protein
MQGSGRGATLPEMMRLLTETSRTKGDIDLQAVYDGREYTDGAGRKGRRGIV